MAGLTQHQAANQPLPPVLIMDQAGGRGKTRAQVEAVSDRQTQMVAQIPPTGGLARRASRLPTSACVATAGAVPVRGG